MTPPPAPQPPAPDAEREALIKPLVWRDMSWKEHVLWESQSVYDYRTWTIRHDADYEFPWVLRPFVPEASNFQSLDEAMEVAQRNHVKQALAMLTEAPTGQVHTVAALTAERDAALAEVTRLRELVTDCQQDIAGYLPPDSNISREQCFAKLLNRLDGDQVRAALTSEPQAAGDTLQQAAERAVREVGAEYKPDPQKLAQCLSVVRPQKAGDGA